jgi:hypothetical protein
MLRESETYRRRHRDSAQTQRSKWHRYEEGKRIIEATALDANDYERRVQALAREIGI